jgi:anaphase-promoting complex subunit 2
MHIDVWTLDELIAGVGSVTRSAAIRALSTWVDRGVLKEDPENTFILLEREEVGGVAARENRPGPYNASPYCYSWHSMHVQQFI